MKIKSLIVTLAAVVASTSLFAQTTLTELNKRFNEANALYNAKDYATALPLLEACLNDAYELEDAYKVIENCQKLIPNCYFRVGLAQVKSKDTEAALVSFTTANDIALLYNDAKTSRNAKSAISQIYRTYGAQAFNSKDYASAIEDFAKGYEVNPQDTELALYLAKSYCELKDFTNGVRVYTDIIALKDRHSKFAEPAAQALSELTYYLQLKAQEDNTAGNKEAAYEALDTLVNIDPMNTANQMFRLNIAAVNQDWDRIIEWGDMTAAFMITPEEQSEVYYLMAVAYDSKNMNDKAVETYKLVTAGDKVEPSKQRIVELNEFIKAQAEAAK